MTSDLDIYRSANVLVKQHGQDAPIHAAMQADGMLDKGDVDGYAVWKRILRAVGQMLRAEPATSLWKKEIWYPHASARKHIGGSHGYLPSLQSVGVVSQDQPGRLVSRV